jgi:methyl-accepting chemotaxis protein
MTPKMARNPSRGGGAKKRVEAVGEVRKAWVATRDQANALKGSGDEAGAKVLVQNKLVPGTVDYIRVTQALVDGQLESVRAISKDVHGKLNGLFTWGASLLVACILLAIYASWSLSRSVSGGIDKNRAIAERIGSGDLSQAVVVEGQDEIADMAAALKRMQDSLVKVVSSVRQGSEGGGNSKFRDCTGKQRSVRKNGKPGKCFGRDRCQHGRIKFNGEPKRRFGTSSEPACHECVDCCHAWW